MGIADHQEEDRKQLSEDRTNLAEDRTLMAVERTMASWIGASFGAIGVGLGFRAIFGAIEPTWLPRLMASSFMALAVLIIITAERRASRALMRLSSHMVDPPKIFGLRVVAFGIAVGACILTVGIWVFFE